MDINLFEKLNMNKKEILPLTPLVVFLVIGFNYIVCIESETSFP